MSAFLNGILSALGSKFAEKLGKEILGESWEAADTTVSFPRDQRRWRADKCLQGRGYHQRDQVVREPNHDLLGRHHGQTRISATYYTD